MTDQQTTRESTDAERAQAMNEAAQDTPPRRKHPMEHVDDVMRSKGHGDKEVEGSGIAAILMHGAAQMGVHASEFVIPADKPAPK